MLLVGCATLPAELPLGPSGYAPVPQPGGPLADAEAALQARIGAERSGFHLLGVNEDSLRWRLALVDSAQHSLDLQYYVWWESTSARRQRRLSSLRSEEHTSELQSLMRISYAVFCLKKKTIIRHQHR